MCSSVPQDNEVSRRGTYIEAPLPCASVNSERSRTHRTTIVSRTVSLPGWFRGKLRREAKTCLITKRKTSEFRLSAVGKDMSVENKTLTRQ